MYTSGNDNYAVSEKLLCYPVILLLHDRHAIYVSDGFKQDYVIRFFMLFLVRYLRCRFFYKASFRSVHTNGKSI